MTYSLKTQNRKSSARQRAALAMIARQAFAVQRELGLVEGDGDTWRADEAQKACGRRISSSLNGDYLLLMSHFLTLAGREREAFDMHLRWQRETMKIMHHALDTELARSGKDRAYADAIARDRFKKPTTQLSADELRWLAWSIHHRK